MEHTQPMSHCVIAIYVCNCVTIHLCICLPFYLLVYFWPVSVFASDGQYVLFCPSVCLSCLFFSSFSPLLSLSPCFLLSLYCSYCKSLSNIWHECISDPIPYMYSAIKYCTSNPSVKHAKCSTHNYTLPVRIYTLILSFFFIFFSTF